ncbi:hypothetical protein AAG068_04715 [Bacillus paramycoides]|uniref:hypothetical protein n=1 Tax=Bacillus cereus group TaxID=86661 RepID=UPI00163AAED5|nr:hypothetical protein [Bacillus toyonensis]MBC2686454.1 hypothetical protein [Bacillus toyonensis]
MNCSSPYEYYYVRVCTDAASYSARATSIDLTIEADDSIKGLYTFDYTVYLQFWNGSSWGTVEKKNGWFTRAAFPSFSLSGRAGGSYRVVADHQRKDTGAKDTIRTPGFTVKR